MAPRLRDDLVAATVDEGGVVYVDLTDPASGSNFRFYDFEYDLAKQLTGRPLEEVVAWASATYQLELTTEALDQFIEKLAGLGFLAGAGAGAQPQAISPSPSSQSGPFGKLPPGMVTAGAEEPIELAASPMFGDPPVAARAPVEIETELSASALMEDSSVPWSIPPFPLATPTESPAHEFQSREPTGAGQDDFKNEFKNEPKSESRRGTIDTGKDDKSGPFSKGRTLHGINLAPLTPLTPLAPPTSDGSAPPLPRLQVTAPPLPTLNSESVTGGSTRRTSTSTSTSETKAPVITPAAGPGTDESPLSLISQAIAAEATAPHRTMPTGSLEASEPPSGVVAGGGVSPNSASWAKALTDEVEKPTGVPSATERRQPPAPEVVVMPPVAEPATPLPRRKAPLILGVLLAGGVAAAVAFALRPEKRVAPAAASASAVHVIAPQPTTYYQWYSPSGTVVAGKDDELGFQVLGKVQDVMPPGTTFSPGEPVARLQGVAVRELNVNRVRARLAFFEQLRDSSRAAGNEVAARQAEANVAARKRELTVAQAQLAELEIRPKAAGQIGQVLVERGALVKPGTPAIRIRAAGPRATFPLPPDGQAKARALGFCRLETVPGTGATDGGATEKAARAIDCSFPALSPGATPDSALAVDVVGAPDLAPGTAVNLASARFDGVFPLPKTAVVHDEAGEAAGGATGTGKSGDHVWIVSAAGDSAEKRAVEIASTVDALALISHGLEAGDSVITDPPADLKAGAPITVAH